MVYYQQISSAFDATKLSAYLAARVTSDLSVVIVSEAAEQLQAALKEAWSAQQSGLLAERDHEPDIAYMAVLTEIITTLQRMTVGYGESDIEHQLLVLHPHQIHGRAWEDRQLLVCCDEVSLQRCLQLFPIAHADFRLLVQCTDISKPTREQVRKLKPLSVRDAETELRDLLRKQADRCERMGIDLNQLVVGKVVDVEQLGTIFKSNGSSLYESFLVAQKRIARLRIIVGRAKAHRALSDTKLHNLKIVTAHLTTDLGNADWQLFDDPLSRRWRQRTL